MGSREETRPPSRFFIGMGRTAVALTALFDLVVLLLLPAAMVVESATDSLDGNIYLRDSSIN